MIYRLDADMNGIGSIRKQVESGAVVNIPCPTNKAYEAACEKLLDTAKPGDIIILDTLTKMMDTFIGDLKLGSEEKAMLPKANVFFADKNYLTVYTAAGQMLLRWLRFLRNRGFRIITTTHEKEQVDQLTYLKKYGPAANESLFNALNASCSDMFRLMAINEALTDELGKVVRPAYSRVLRLRPTDDTIAKFHVDFDHSAKVPAELWGPTLPRLYKALDNQPEWLVIYGAPGVGKTTLSVSDATTSKASAPSGA